MNDMNAALRRLSGTSFRSKDDVTDFVSKRQLYLIWSNELDRIVQSRENFPLRSWSSRTTFLAEYKAALHNVLSNAGGAGAK